MNPNSNFHKQEIILTKILIWFQKTCQKLKHPFTQGLGPKKLDLIQLDTMLAKDFTSHNLRARISALTFTNASVIWPESSDECCKFICQIIHSTSDLGPRIHFESFKPRRLTRLIVESSSSILIKSCVTLSRIIRWLH